MAPHEENAAKQAGECLDDLLDRKFGSYKHEFTERDVILYNMGCGCRRVGLELWC